MKAVSIFKSMAAFKVDVKNGRKMTPYSVIVGEPDADLFGYTASDPGGQQWESLGLKSGSFGFADEEFFRDIDGKGVLCFVQLAKRNLPARVVRDRVDKMADDIFAQTGRKPGRKERRDLQDDATMSLLPQSFINHSIVPVIFTRDGLMLVFTSTPKRYEAILALFVTLLNDVYELEISATYHPSSNIVSPVAWMTGKALALRDDTAIEDEAFVATDFAVMKGDEIGMIRVKDRELGCSEVATALKSGYRIEQIGLLHQSTRMHFRLSQNLILTSIKFDDDTLGELRDNMGEDGANEIQAVAWLIIEEYRKVLADLVTDMAAPPDEDEL